MMSVRAVTILRLHSKSLSVLNGALDQRFVNVEKVGSYGKVPIGTLVAKGTMVEAVQCMGFWPITPDATHIHKSIQDLHLDDVLSPLENKLAGAESYAGLSSLQNMVANLRIALRNIEQSMPTAVLESHLTHIKTQAGK
jgi:hypothetical protein